MLTMSPTKDNMNHLNNHTTLSRRSRDEFSETVSLKNLFVQLFFN